MTEERIDIPTCECEHVVGESAAIAAKQLPDDRTLYDLSDLFKIFGDSTRMKILFALDGGEMCVCDIASIIDMTKSAVSHQLKILRQNKLVTYRKCGKNVIYSLADDHVKSIIELALEHIKE